LAIRLEDIGVIDAVIGPMAILFPWILGAHGQTVTKVASDLGKAWSKGLSSIDVEAFTALREFLPPDSDLADCWIRTAGAARAGEYEMVVRQLVLINSLVMQSRGGAPWVVLQDDRIDARFQDGQGRIPDQEQLISLISYPYFIPSLRAIAKSLADA
jgi:hypothetical protein